MCCLLCVGDSVCMCEGREQRVDSIYMKTVKDRSRQFGCRLTIQDPVFWGIQGFDGGGGA